MTTKSEGMMIPGKLKWYVILALALWLAFSGVAAAEQLYVNESGWWRDGGAFNASTAPIQAAVDAAAVGDTIFVHGGNYYENVDVDKPRLTLEGEGANVVTVAAASAEDHVFEVTADYVNISGFAVRGATGSYKAGIYLGNVDHCNISENHVSNNWRGILLFTASNNTLQNNTAPNNRGGIVMRHSNNNMLQDNTVNSNKYEGVYIEHSSNNTLRNNTANSNNDYGIALWYSDSNTLTNNTANLNTYFSGISLYYSSSNMLQNNTCSNNRYGIYMYYSSNSTLQENMMSENRYNFHVYGCGIFHYIQNINMSNTVDGKPIYYWIGQEDKKVPNNAGFVGVVNSTNITVSDLTLTNSIYGVLFAYTENSRIENVTTPNNWYGIYLTYSSNNTLQNNTCSNIGYGIYLTYSSNNTLQNNTCSNIEYSGIKLWCSGNNTLQGNTANSNNYGIWLWYSSSNTLTNNTANSNNCYGIRMDDSSNNTLTKNTISENTYNFGVCGGHRFSYYVHNIDTNNTVDEKPIYYWVDQHDKVIPDDAGFVGVVNSTNITVSDLVLTKNSEGVIFAYTENSRIENVTTSGSDHGIYLTYSSNNTLAENNATNNRIGIQLRYSSNNTLTNNKCLNNSDGIYITYSSSNMLRGNICSNNSLGIHLCDLSNNNIITCNWIQNNIEQGFCLPHSHRRSTNNSISYNNIITNGKYNVSSSGWEWKFYNEQSAPVKAKHNFWGAGMNNSTIDASIYDDEEGGWGEVEFYPFETEPVPCAPTPDEPPAFTTADAVIALQIAAGSRPPDSRWDVSGDGSVTSLDALMILQAAAGNREVHSGGCEGLDQNVLRRYDHNKNGLIDSNEMETAIIDLDEGRITQSECDQVKYAYEHNCPVEQQSEGDFHADPPHPTPDEPSEFATTDAVIALASPMLRFASHSKSQPAAVRSTRDGMSAATSASPRSMR